MSFDVFNHHCLQQALTISQFCAHIYRDIIKDLLYILHDFFQIQLYVHRAKSWKNKCQYGSFSLPFPSILSFPLSLHLHPSFLPLALLSFLLFPESGKHRKRTAKASVRYSDARKYIL